MSTTINALLVKQGVNMGDHGQDVTVAVEAREGETVREFVDRVLTERDWRPDLPRQVRGDWYVTLRLVEPEPVDDGLPMKATAF